jgi:uncharacterized protein YndB with AHSA1/START domain
MPTTVETQMLIRRPAREVFNAFIDPAVTTQFWFTRSTGKLVTGASVTWYWDMYNVSDEVHVQSITPDKQIIITWDTPETTVEFNFQDMGDGTTYVVIKNYGLHEKGDDLIKKVNDLTGGFTTVLDGLKAWLEHSLKLNLIGDKFPPGTSDHGA